MRYDAKASIIKCEQIQRNSGSLIDCNKMPFKFKMHTQLMPMGFNSIYERPSNAQSMIIQNNARISYKRRKEVDVSRPKKYTLDMKLLATPVTLSNQRANVCLHAGVKHRIIIMVLRKSVP